MRKVKRACLLIIGIQSTACYSWHMEQAAPADVVAAGRPERIRIREPGGSTLVVVAPTVAADTLRGRSESGGYRVAIPLAEVLQLETRRANGPSSVLVVAGLGAGAAAITACLLAHC